jgi:hypothetical protein
MKRVAHRLVVFTFEPTEVARFWLTESYFPEIVALERGRSPSVAEIARELGPCRVEHVAVPHDCADGFLAAYWRRPDAYLDPGVRAGISALAQLDQDVISRGVARLTSDLDSGAWGSASATFDRSTRWMWAIRSWLRIAAKVAALSACAR